MRSYEANFNTPDKTLEKQRRLNLARIEINHIVDKLGKGIDEDIKETVVILKALEFPTTSSCAGHTEIDGYSPPYIEIHTPAPDGWKEDVTQQNKWRAENLIHKNRLLVFLQQFYEHRIVPTDVKLIADNMGIYGGFRLETLGTNQTLEQLGITTKEEILNKIRAYQKEMKDFTDFLHSQYLKP